MLRIQHIFPITMLSLLLPWSVGAVGGSGTANYLAKWSDSSNLKNSLLYDSGYYVGIGTASPARRLDIMANSSSYPLRFRYHSSESTYGELVSNTNGIGLAARNVASGYGIQFYTSTGTSDTERMRITDSGKVGIGVTSPTQQLDVNGYVKGTGLCIGTDCRTSWPTSSSGTVTGTGTTGYISQWSDTSSLANSPLYVNNGNVGIGTNTPSTLFDVSQSSGQAKMTAKSDTDGGTYLRLERYGVNNNFFYVETGAANNDNLAIHRGVAPYTDFVVGNNGYVGISTLPDKPLTINAGSNDAIHLISNANHDWYVGPNVGGVTGFGIYDITTAQTRFGIDFNGNVGIGTTSPTQKLDVAGYVKGQSGLCIGDDCRTSWPSSSGGTGNVSGSGTINYLTKWTGGNSVSNSILYDTGTHIGIGTTNPSYKLQVEAVSKRAIYAKTSDDSDEAVAIYAESTTTGAYDTAGVWGVTKAKGNSGGQPIGVRGDATNDKPTQGQFGLLGYTYARSQTSGLINAGIWGGAVGVPGSEGDYSGQGSGIVGESYSTYNTSGGGVFYALSTTGAAEGVAAATHSTNPNSYAVYGSGKIGSSSTIATLVDTPTHGPVELYGTAAPEAWFEDYGEAKLQHGRVHIDLDKAFLETVTINAQNPMHVFVQAYGDAELYVERGENGFDVIERDGKQSDTTFSYRIVAKRKHYENLRLRNAEVMIDKFMEPALSRDQRNVLNQQRNLPIDDPSQLLPKLTPAD